MSRVAVPVKYFREDCGLTPDEKMVYVTLFIKASKLGEIQGLTKSSLGKTLGFSVNKVSKIIAGLQEKTLVISTRGGRKGNSYILPEKICFTPEEKKFTLVDRKVFLNKRLPARVRLLHATLKSFCYKVNRNQAKLYYKHLSNILKISSRSISRYSLRLRQLGLMKAIRRKFLPSIYRVSDNYDNFQYEKLRWPTYERKPTKKPQQQELSQIDKDIAFERALRIAGW